MKTCFNRYLVMQPTYPQRKAKERGINSLEYYRKGKKVKSEESSIPKDCVICLEKVELQGALSGCDHWFCFICIYEWSNVSIDYAFITIILQKVLKNGYQPLFGIFLQI